MTQLTAPDGHRLDAYEVGPQGATAAVVIVQEIFGVNGHIRSVVDRYASFGYRAIAPAMFDRVELGVELDYSTTGVEQGRALRQKLSWDDSVLDVGAAAEHVSGTGPVAVVGYCYGGSMAWLAAASLPIAAAVGYYGGQIVDFIDLTPRVPTMLHFGALDHAIPLDGVHAVAERHPEVIVHVYDEAGHGFNCDVRGSYHPAAAAQAEERTREFLALHL